MTTIGRKSAIRSALTHVPEPVRSKTSTVSAIAARYVPEARRRAWRRKSRRKSGALRRRSRRRIAGRYQPAPSAPAPQSWRLPGGGDEQERRARTEVARRRTRCHACHRHERRRASARAPAEDDRRIEGERASASLSATVTFAATRNGRRPAVRALGNDSRPLRTCATPPSSANTSFSRWREAPGDRGLVLACPRGLGIADGLVDARHRGDERAGAVRELGVGLAGQRQVGLVGVEARAAEVAVVLRRRRALPPGGEVGALEQDRAGLRLVGGRESLLRLGVARRTRVPGRRGRRQRDGEETAAHLTCRPGETGTILKPGASGVVGEVRPQPALGLGHGRCRLRAGVVLDLVAADPADGEVARLRVGEVEAADARRRASSRRSRSARGRPRSALEQVEQRCFSEWSGQAG